MQKRSAGLHEYNGVRVGLVDKISFLLGLDDGRANALAPFWQAADVHPACRAITESTLFNEVAAAFAQVEC
jgi:hypothetical protein